MRARARRHREQAVLAEHFGFTRDQILSLGITEYQRYVEVFKENQKD